MPTALFLPSALIVITILEEYMSFIFGYALQGFVAGNGQMSGYANAIKIIP